MLLTHFSLSILCFCGYYWKAVTTGNRCVTCATGYYLISPSTCQPCNSYCMACTSTLCNSCMTGYTKSGANCIANAIGSCPTLISNCLSCTTSPLVCTLCISGYYPASSSCIQCSSNCNNCDSSGCTICNTGYALLISKTC